MPGFNHSGIPGFDRPETLTPGLKAYMRMIQKQLATARVQLSGGDIGKSLGAHITWDSVRQQRKSSKSMNRYPSLSPSHENYHLSPSGLLVSNDLNPYLQSQPGLEARFGDVMSANWTQHMAGQWRIGGSANDKCPSCGVPIPPHHWHSCGAMGTLPPSIRSVPGYYITSAVASSPPPLPIERRSLPVVGFRAWRTERNYVLGRGRLHRLKSTGVAAYWQPGVNVALCSGNKACARRPYENANFDTAWAIAPIQSPLTVPNERHDCGFYVLSTLDELEGHITVGEEHIVGAVMGWGKVVQHGSEGWRAQYARIVALMDLKLSKPNDKLAQTISKRYGVPVLERDALELAVKEFGDAVINEEK